MILPNVVHFLDKILRYPRLGSWAISKSGKMGYFSINWELMAGKLMLSEKVTGVMSYFDKWSATIAPI